MTGDKKFVPIAIQLYQHISPDNPVFPSFVSGYFQSCCMAAFSVFVLTKCGMSLAPSLVILSRTVAPSYEKSKKYVVLLCYVVILTRVVYLFTVLSLELDGVYVRARTRLA